MKLTRRELLKRSGQTALGLGIASQAAWLASCGVRSSDLDWQALADQMQGSLLLPDAPSFNQVGLPSNLAYSDVIPQAKALCNTPGDVQAAIRWARENEVPLAVRSGGHNYAGYSTTTGLLIDVSPMNLVEVDATAGIVSVGAGAKVDKIDRYMTALDMIVPTARCLPVGIAGVALGGGLGMNGRKFGLTSDNMLETRIVTADGELLTCSEEENADLFWALRGGGGGNFGVNVDFKLRAYPVEKASVFNLVWVGDGLAEIFSLAQEISINAPDEFTMILAPAIFQGASSLAATNVELQFIGQYLGPLDELQEMLAPLMPQGTRITTIVEEQDIATATQTMAQAGQPDAFLTKSAFVPSPIPDEGIETIFEWIHRWPPNSRAADFALFSWGGAYNQMPADATAFVHRTADFVVEMDASWHPDDNQAIIDASKNWIQDFHKAMEPYFDGSTYQNFIDPTQKNWEQSYYGQNFNRLVQVKQAYDPDNIFNFEQSIPTEV